MRAAVYCRVSSSQQEHEGSSLDTQAAACNAYAQQHGYTVTRIYADTHTGSEYRERPALSELRSAVQAGEIDTVLVYALDRLSRSQLHTAVLIDEFEHHGATLDLVTEEFDDTSTGRLIRSVQSFAAELEREKITERTVRGRKARIQSGRPGVGGRPLYGYDWGDAEKTHYVINPSTGPVVRRIFREYAHGASLREIALALTSEGIPTPGGSKRWQHVSVRNVIAHPNYTGDAYGWAWEKPASGSGRSIFNPERAIRLPDDVVPALVDRAIWEACQERLDSNRRRASKNTAHAHLAILRGGLAVCGHCGYNLSTQWGEGQLHYRCVSRFRHRTDCTTHRAPIAVLDEAAWQQVTEFFADAESARDVISHRPRRIHENEHEIEELERTVAATERRQQNLIRSMAAFDDVDAADAIRAQIVAYTDQLRIQQAELDSLRSQRRARQAGMAERRAWYEQARTIVANLDTLTVDERRDLVAALGIKVRLYRREHSKAPPVFSVDPPGFPV